MTENGYVCDECGFKLWLPVLSNPTTHLGLYDDARFPGRCILVFGRHVEHLTELTRDESCTFMEDGRLAAAAIHDVTGARRINYAVLGNTEPHLHLHLVPRFDAEPKPKRPPWEDPRPTTPLAPDRIAELRSSLRRVLVRRSE